MELKLTHLRHIALPSANLSKSVQFYRETLGAAFIAEYESPGLAFFSSERRDCCWSSCTGRPGPHLIHRDNTGTFGPAGEEEWMAFFKDPDGNVLALASRIPAKVV